MTIETYTLQEPVELGQLVITELKIDRRPKGKYWRVAQKPMPVEATQGEDGMEGEVTMYFTQGAQENEVMKAMTNQPQQVIDELGKVDYSYLYEAAREMLGNFAHLNPAPEKSAA